MQNRQCLMVAVFMFEAKNKVKNKTFFTHENYVELAFRDEGHGISEEDKNKNI